MIDYKQQYSRYLQVFNSYLEKTFSSLRNSPKVLIDAMSYAVKDGGKRVRPILCFSTAEMLGVPICNVESFALAIECIHSYSLVHDDLPAMDNDDYRRGKLSTHKKFGEANGILAGDALLNFAFEHCLSKKDFSVKDAKALSILAEYAGFQGMIAGQVLDLESENNNSVDEKALYEIYDKKTAKLITAPLLISSIMADGKHFEQLKEFGYNLGVLFQIVDDIMDVEGSLESIGKTPNKDENANKLTAIKIFGLDGAKKRAEVHYKKCKNIINQLENREFLDSLTEAMYLRRK